MNSKHKKIALVFVTITFAIWYSSSLIKENRTLARTIPNKIKIKQELEISATKLEQYNKYCKKLRQYCLDNPVNQSQIIKKLKDANVYSQDSFNIKRSVSERIGPFDFVTYHVEGQQLQTQQIGPLLHITQAMSLGTPKVDITQNDTISVKIEIYNLSPVD